MLSGIPSLSRNLWVAAYFGVFAALMHFVRVAVDGFDDHKWFDGAFGVYWALFALFVMVARYPNGLRKFPIVEPPRPTPRPSRRQGSSVGGPQSDLGRSAGPADQ